MKKLEEYVRSIPDFPEPGIIFRDITTILQDADGLQLAIDGIQKSLEGVDYDIVVGPESRGFIFGVPVAYAMHKGFVPIRKKGKLPCKTVSVSYDLEYGSAVLEMHEDAIKPGQKVVIVDDLIATGGTTEAIVKLIEKMGGGIEVSSREGEGTTFRFTIPYSRPDTEGPGKAADGARRHAQRATEAVEGKRILVAEDIDSNFMLIDALIGRRFDLLRARNGEEAVALFGRERPDLVLMDLKMPVMDGYEATRLIRAEAPTAPLVVMSAFAYEGDIERAYEAGCTDYVTKPVSRKRLMEVIERYLG